MESTEPTLVSARDVADLEAFERTVFDEAPDAVFVVRGGQGARGGIVYANPSACDLLGHEAEQLRGRTLLSLTHADDAAAMRAQLEQVATGLTEPSAVLVRLIPKIGPAVSGELHVRAVHDDGRSPRRLVVRFGGRGATPSATSGHRGRELRWAAWILDATDDAVISMTIDEECATWNRGAERLFGYRADEMIGRNMVSAIVPSEMVGEERRILARVFTGVRVDQRRTLRVHSSGALVPVRLTVSPIIDDDGMIVGASLICHDMAEEQRHDDRLMHQATHDPLTNLPNRALAIDRLAHATALAARTDRTVALLYVDLDGFKNVNDTHGHEAGDDLLREVSRRIVQALRPCDTAARIGGDEFIVICEDCSADTTRARHEADHVGRRIADAIASPYTIAGQTTTPSATIGIAIATAHQAPEELMRNADTAMYNAKQSTIELDLRGTNGD